MGEKMNAFDKGTGLRQNNTVGIMSGAFINPIALRKAKVVCNFGLSECNRVKEDCNARIVKYVCYTCL